MTRSPPVVCDSRCYRAAATPPADMCDVQAVPSKYRNINGLLDRRTSLRASWDFDPQHPVNAVVASPERPGSTWLRRVLGYYRVK